MKKYTPKFELKQIQTKFPRKQIKTGYDANKFIRQFYCNDIEIYESFFILLLNTAHHTIGYAKISQGGVAGTVVDAKLIAKYAVEAIASSVILAHNHPSGNLTASKHDKEITVKITKGLELLDIKVLDHIILSPYNEDYLSMKQLNLF